MHLSTPVALAAIRSKAVVLLLLIHCFSRCLWLALVLVSFLVLQEESAGCFTLIVFLLIFCVSSSRCHGLASHPCSYRGFVGWTITKMATEMVTACRFALVDNLSHLSPQISSNNHIWITFITFLTKFKYGLCQMNANQDGHQNVCRLSICSQAVKFCESRQTDRPL